jgi:hypothetical protein
MERSWISTMIDFIMWAFVAVAFGLIIGSIIGWRGQDR